MIFSGPKSKVYIIFRKTFLKGKNKVIRSQQIIIVKPILQSSNIALNTDRHVIFTVCLRMLYCIYIKYFRKDHNKL